MRKKSKVNSIHVTSGTRYTIDASVFINAFRPHERGHSESLELLSTLREAGNAIIVPTLVLTEIAAALARANDNCEEAIEYAEALAQLPNITFVPLSLAIARKAGEAAANFRLRGADAIYLEVARRYGRRSFLLIRNSVSAEGKPSSVLRPRKHFWNDRSADNL